MPFTVRRAVEERRKMAKKINKPPRRKLAKLSPITEENNPFGRRDLKPGDKVKIRYPAYGKLEKKIFKDPCVGLILTGEEATRLYDLLCQYRPVGLESVFVVLDKLSEI